MASRRKLLGWASTYLLGGLSGCAGILENDHRSGPSTDRDEVEDPIDEPMQFEYASDSHRERLLDTVDHSDPAGALLTSADDASELRLDAPDANYGGFVGDTEFERQFLVAGEVRRPESGWQLAVDEVTRISEEWVDVCGHNENEHGDTDPIESFVSALVRVSGDSRKLPEAAHVTYEFVGDATEFETT